jgi:hypothetical protein
MGAWSLSAIGFGAVALVACGSPPKSAESATVSATATPAPTETATVAPPPKAASKPTARITAIEPSKESIPDMRVRIVFENPTAGPCSFKSYTLRWGKASKRIALEALTIPPGESRERSIKVHPADGDLGALSADSASLELETSCP